MNQMRSDEIGADTSAGRGRARVVQWVVVLVLVALSALGWHYRDQLLGSGEPAARQGGGRAVAVEVGQATTGPVVRSVEAVGTVIANQAIDVVPRVTGTIAEIVFTEGQMVEKGQLLVQLDSRELQAERAAAQAVLDNAQSLFDRNRTLLQQRSVAEARFEEVAAQLKVAQSRLKVIESQLADLRITAPFRGKVGLRRVSPGALVTSGTVITTLDDVDTVKVDFSVPEAAFARLGPGQEVLASAEAYPERTFVGTVQTIDTRVDPTTRAVNVRAVIPNGDGALKPGMFLIVNLVVERHENAVLIAEQALVPVGTRQFVFQIENGQVVRREVQIGHRQPGKVEVVSGLKAGEQVIVGGVQKIREGSRVTVQGQGQGQQGQGQGQGAAAPRPTGS